MEFSTGLQSGMPPSPTSMTQVLQAVLACTVTEQRLSSLQHSHTALTTKGHPLVFVYASENADTDIC